MTKLAENDPQSTANIADDRVLAPVRIQRSRVKGFKMPENTLYVGRGSKWGNPFKIDDNQNDILILDPFTKVWKYIGLGSIQDCIKEYEHLFHPIAKQDNDYRIQEWANRFSKLDLSELKGRNLACWCSLKCTCHADVLLRLSNGC